MFSRRSLFAALGLALPLAAVTAAEAATSRHARRPKKAAKKAAVHKPRRRRHADIATPTDTLG